MRKYKTLTSWQAECTDIFEKTYGKYSAAFSDRTCPDNTRMYYGKVAHNYHQFITVLNHVQNMKIHGDFDGTTAVHPASCGACKAGDAVHIEDLEKTYVKYKRWIENLPVPMSLEIN